MGETTKEFLLKPQKNIIKPLLPDRHPNQDFFVCDILDAVPKDDMASMEHPVLSLSTQPDTRLRQSAALSV